MSQPRQPALAVSVVVRAADGRLLVVRRAAHRPAGGYWTAVTGKLEPGESMAEAARREVCEETGLLVRLTAEDVHRSFTSGGEFELVWFVAEPSEPAEPLTLDPDELADARWLALDEVLALEPMFASTRAFYASLGSAAPTSTST